MFKDLIYTLVSPLLTVFYELKMSSKSVFLIGLAASLSSVYYFWNKNPLIGLWFLLAWWALIIAEEKYSKMYKLPSYNWSDPIKLLMIVIICIAIWMRYIQFSSTNIKALFIGSVLTLFVTSAMNMGCENHKGPLKKLCRGDNYILKFFDISTLMIILVTWIILISKLVF